MKNVRKARKGENIYVKSFICVLLMLLAFGFAMGSHVLYKMLSVGLVGQKTDSFYESDYVYHKAKGDAYNIVTLYLENGKEQDMNTGMNYSYDLYGRENGTDKLIYSSKKLAESASTQTFYYYIEYGNGYTNTIDISYPVSNNYESQYEYKVIINVYEMPGLYEDGYATAYNDYVSLQKYQNSIIPLLIGGVVAAVICLIYLTIAAGHDTSHEGLTINFIDKIPYDLFTIVCFAGIFAVFTETRYLEPEYNVEAVMIYLILTGFSMVILLWYLSTVKRIKNRDLFKNTIVYMVLHFVWMIFMNLKLLWKALLIMGGFGILMMACYSDQNPVLAALVYIVLCVLATLYIIQANEIRDRTHDIANGNVSTKINTSKMLMGLKDHGNDINSIQDGIKIAVDKEMKSEHLKTELITNVSHDIKTPLTSIINYVDLLQKEHSEEEEQKYLDVLARQSARLKKLIEDLTEASKASTGNITATLTKININEMISQSLSEYTEKMQNSNLEVVVNLPEEPLFAMADGNLLWRILNNLYSNVCKYSMSNTRVYIDAYKEGKDVCIAVKNISRDMLNISPDELMERFVRGDSSRHTEGSGLGLNIAKSLAEIQNGKLSLEIDGDLFKTVVTLPEA